VKAEGLWEERFAFPHRKKNKKVDEAKGTSGWGASGDATLRRISKKMSMSLPSGWQP